MMVLMTVIKTTVTMTMLVSDEDEDRLASIQHHHKRVMIIGGCLADGSVMMR